MGFRRLAIIIGAMKSATTSLFVALKDHPQICGSRKKEPNFFVSDESYARGRMAYESCWRYHPRRHLVALEASTAYTKYPMFADVPRRMREFGYDFRFVYLVRNPVDRYESHCLMRIARGRKTTFAFEGIDSHVLETSRYAAQLARYLRHFDKERILVIAYDDLVADLDGEAKRILTHIGVDTQFTPQMPRFLDGERRFAPIVRELSDKGDLGPGKAKGGDKALYRLPAGLRSKLMKELEADMRTLERDWQVDIARWGF